MHVLYGELTPRKYLTFHRTVLAMLYALFPPDLQVHAGSGFSQDRISQVRNEIFAKLVKILLRRPINPTTETLRQFFTAEHRDNFTRELLGVLGIGSWTIVCRYLKRYCELGEECERLTNQVLELTSSKTTKSPFKQIKSQASGKETRTSKDNDNRDVTKKTTRSLFPSQRESIAGLQRVDEMGVPLPQTPEPSKQNSKSTVFNPQSH